MNRDVRAIQEFRVHLMGDQMQIHVAVAEVPGQGGIRAVHAAKGVKISCDENPR